MLGWVCIAWIQNEHELALLEQSLLVPARNLLCFLWEFRGNKSVGQGENRTSAR